MRRLTSIVTGATLVIALAAPAFAGQPTITKIDFSLFEPFAEADWTAECGFPVDVEFVGHILVHEFSTDRLVEVDSWRTLQTYTANGTTVTARVAGPDHLWVAGDGTLYQAITGSSPSDGNVGRIVIDVDADTVVSTRGRAIDNPFLDLCATLAP